MVDDRIQLLLDHLPITPITEVRPAHVVVVRIPGLQVRVVRVTHGPATALEVQVIRGQAVRVIPGVRAIPDRVAQAVPAIRVLQVQEVPDLPALLAVRHHDPAVARAGLQVQEGKLIIIV